MSIQPQETEQHLHSASSEPHSSTPTLTPQPETEVAAAKIDEEKQQPGPSTIPGSPFPEGGLKGWAAVVGAWLFGKSTLFSLVFFFGTDDSVCYIRICQYFRGLPGILSIHRLSRSTRFQHLMGGIGPALLPVLTGSGVGSIVRQRLLPPSRHLGQCYLYCLVYRPHLHKCGAIADLQSIHDLFG